MMYDYISDITGIGNNSLTNLDDISATQLSARIFPDLVITNLIYPDLESFTDNSTIPVLHVADIPNS